LGLLQGYYKNDTFVKVFSTTMGNKKIKSSLHNFFKSNFNRFTLAGSLIILSCIYLFSTRTSKLNIFPIQPDFTVGFVNDSAMGGHSQIVSRNISDSSISIDFQLVKSIYEAYVGFNIQHTNAAFINLKPYNTVEFEVRGEGLNNILFYLIVQNTDTTLQLVDNDIYITYNLEITPELCRYRIPLSQLTPPDWWYATNKLVPNKSINIDFSKVRFINFANGPTPISNNTLSLKIHSISFLRNNSYLILILSLIEAILILLLLSRQWYVSQNKRVTTEILITYNSVSSKNQGQNIEFFLEYINGHFHDAGLTLEKVAEITGINQRRIAHHILHTFACNFKTYVNQIRINESKRLIKNTDLNMGEIAYKVGFNSPNHFNRVFKSIESVNPTEFKELK
jgi:AraC-like DNA-binding protein